MRECVSVCVCCVLVLFGKQISYITRDPRTDEDHRRVSLRVHNIFTVIRRVGARYI